MRKSETEYYLSSHLFLIGNVVSLEACTRVG